MELGKPQPVGVLNDKRIDVRNIDAGFDDGRADQHLRLSVGDRLHHGGELLFVHLAVGNADAHLVAEQRFELCRAPVDRLHTVVQVIDLPAARKLAADRVRHHAPVVLEHVGLHALAVARRHFDGGHVPDAGQRHIERTRDRRRRQGQRVHLARELLQLFLVRHAEALLLVDDEQTQVLEPHVLLQQAVRTDEKIDPARRRVL